MRFSRTGKIAIAFGVSAAGIATAKTSSGLMARDETVQELSAKFMGKPFSDDLEKTRSRMRTRMELMIMNAQGEICRRLAEIEGSDFRVDRWERKEGGGGISCVLQDGMSLKNATL